MGKGYVLYIIVVHVYLGETRLFLLCEWSVPPDQEDARVSWH